MLTAEQCMARALRLAERGRYSTHPNPRVGCVIARDGEVVGEGWHARAGEPRAEAGAVLTSSATVLADDPRLDVRDFAAEPLRQPDRIVVDARARVPAAAKVWAKGARRLWLTGRPATAPVDVERVDVPVAADG